MKRVLGQLGILLDKRQKKGLFLLFWGAAFVALLDTLSVSLMAPFMALLMDMGSIKAGAFYSVAAFFFGEISSASLLKILSLFFIALYLFRGMAKVFYNFWQARLIARYRSELSVKLFSYVMHKPYDYHLFHNTAETQRLINADVCNAFHVVTNFMLTASSGLVSMGILVVLLSMDWKLTITLFIVVFLFLQFVRKYLKKFIQKMANHNFVASAEINKWVGQSIGGLKNIYVKQKQEYYIRHFGAVARCAAVAQGNYNAVDGIPKVMLDTLCMIMVFGIVLIQLLVGHNVTENLPLFATFALAALRLVPVFGQITSTINSIAFYRPSLDIICDTLQAGAAKAEREKEILRQGDGCPKDITEGIQVSHVSFRYKDTEKMLFTDLSLTIPAKKSVAFVGGTGSGKTTLADIILGLHEPTEGKILVDGMDIRQNPAAWAGLIGYIPQFIYLSDDSIRANVALGDSQQAIDDGWIWDCLARAQMKDYVQGLPNGLDTMIGENGIRLSGGQRQRIGIARALYCKPRFLLMDEATSSLDNDTEKAIVDSMNTLSGDLTMLIIAHRLSTIEGCDLVYRIENGKAVIEKQR